MHTRTGRNAKVKLQTASPWAVQHLYLQPSLESGLELAEDASIELARSFPDEDANHGAYVAQMGPAWQTSHVTLNYGPAACRWEEPPVGARITAGVAGWTTVDIIMTIDFIGFCENIFVNPTVRSVGALAWLRASRCCWWSSGRRRFWSAATSHDLLALVAN